MCFKSFQPIKRFVMPSQELLKQFFCVYVCVFPLIHQLFNKNLGHSHFHGNAPEGAILRFFRGAFLLFLAPAGDGGL